MNSAPRAHVLKTIMHSVSVLHHAADQGVLERRYADALHESKAHIAELIAIASKLTAYNHKLMRSETDALRAALDKVGDCA